MNTVKIGVLRVDKYFKALLEDVGGNMWVTMKWPEWLLSAKDARSK